MEFFHTVKMIDKSIQVIHKTVGKLLLPLVCRSKSQEGERINVGFVLHHPQGEDGGPVVLPVSPTSPIGLSIVTVSPSFTNIFAHMGPYKEVDTSCRC